jgi:hypothetical protein
MPAGGADADGGVADTVPVVLRHSRRTSEPVIGEAEPVKEMRCGVAGHESMTSMEKSS